jgi:hypothetical protein
MTDVSQHGCQTRPIDSAIAFNQRMAANLFLKAEGCTQLTQPAPLAAQAPEYAAKGWHSPTGFAPGRARPKIARMSAATAGRAIARPIHQRATIQTKPF